MSIFFSILFLMSFGNTSEVPFTQSKKNTLRAKISTTLEGNTLHITAMATNTTANNQNIVYVLLVEKNKNKGGNRSNNSQRGSAMIESYKTKKLSTTVINTTSKDIINISLRIYGKGSELLSEDTVTIPQ
ncbi:hypothetical protein [Rasiella sp. SM2506]|uniref:hypothetical protein n=1 Tax=Rasiella sp. SM2506 TaxID=3423914 RepID=UPI003D791FD3